jgi:hypothetical protein
MGIFSSISKGIGGGVKELTGIDVNAGPGDALYGKVKTAQAGDANNYAYLGSAEEEAKYRNALQGKADAAQGRGAYQMDMSGVDGAMSGQQEALGMDADARGSQRDALGLYRDAARGNAPSVAAAQQEAGLQEATRSGRNMAASAVGVNPLLAAGNAASASADMARRTTSDAAALRAREIAEARAGYAGLAGTMRGQDQSRAQGFLAGGDLSLRGEMGQGQLEMQQRGLNDSRSRDYQQFVQGVNSDALAAKTAYGNAQTQASIANANNSVQRRAQNQKGINDAIGAAGSMFGVGGF